MIEYKCKKCHDTYWIGTNPCECGGEPMTKQELSEYQFISNKFYSRFNRNYKQDNGLTRINKDIDISALDKIFN